MKNYLNIIIAYSIMLGLIILVGIFQSWSIALTIFNYCMISAVEQSGLIELKDLIWKSLNKPHE